MVKKVLYIIAPQDFRDEEYFEPKAILEENGFVVDTASKDVSTATGMFGGEANIDIDISEVDIDEYEALIFSGGKGALKYVNDPTINKLINKADDNRILVCAICIAPVILANNGILQDMDATVWNEDGEQAKILTKFGANYVNETVVVHNKIITGNGPKASKEFGETILRNL